MKIDHSVHKYLEDNHLLPSGDHHLYVGVKGGGCSGLHYVFDVVKWDPEKFVALDALVCTDNKSLLFLKNCTLIYKVTVGAAVLTVENPAAKSTCGCGESFAV